MSPSTIWRILDGDALQPWRSRSWLFPRDPQFAEKGGRVLDLYAGYWEGQPLHPDDCVLSADEKTSIQARVRRHPTTPPLPGQPMRVEHEYERGGALAYLAAWDVRRGGVMGRCEPTTGKAPFGRLVDQVMQQEPYRSAPRVFWIVDQGSSHRGDKAARELQARYPNLILVHLPTHASWLNQIELYFSIVQRKVLTPNDFPDLAAVEQRLLAFEALYNDTARPFNWRFTRADLTARLAQLAAAPEPAVAEPVGLPTVPQAA
jgi:DDE superfamily endonuclease